MSGTVPSVSVVISTYNRGSKLVRAIASVLAQTYSDIELIVVDNASIDDTEAVVRGFKDARIRYIRHDSNKGGPAARNTGINSSRAAFIALLDDDDEWGPSKIEKQFQKFASSLPMVGVVYVGTEIYDEHLGEIIRVNKPTYRGRVYERLLLATILGSVSSVMVRRSCFDKVGLFDEGLTSCQDWDMWLRIARHFDFEFVDETLARINMHGEQISTNYKALIPGRTRMVTKHADEFKMHPDIYIVHLKRLGKLHFINGTWKQGIYWFKEAVKLRPIELVKVIGWCVLEFPRVRYFSAASKFIRYTGPR